MDYESSAISYSTKMKKDAKKYKQKYMVQVIKNDTQGLLMGNPCMEEVTQEMGFIYVAQPKGQPGNNTALQRNVYNFLAKLKITLRNGPFWKSQLNKKRNECRRSTGDFTG